MQVPKLRCSVLYVHTHAQRSPAGPSDTYAGIGGLPPRVEISTACNSGNYAGRRRECYKHSVAALLDRKGVCPLSKNVPSTKDHCILGDTGV